jgi:hypothetical protein
MWSQETSSEIFYVGWVWEGNTEQASDEMIQPWLNWKVKFLSFRGSDLFIMDYPPVSNSLMLPFLLHAIYSHTKLTHLMPILFHCD